MCFPVCPEQLISSLGELGFITSMSQVVDQVEYFNPGTVTVFSSGLQIIRGKQNLFSQAALPRPHARGAGEGEKGESWGPLGAPCFRPLDHARGTCILFLSVADIESLFHPKEHSRRSE